MVSLKESSEKFFRFSGVASSESRDSYGEIIKQRGIDLSLVNQGKAIVTAEHADNSIGRIERAELKNERLYIEGIVYIKTVRAKQFYDLLKRNDPDNPVTLSIEFVNPEYYENDKSILTDIILTGVALVGLREEPSNKDAYAKLLKSVSKSEIFNELLRRSNKSPSFKDQLLRLLAKHRL